MALLEIDDVCKTFGSLKAVDGVSFDVEAGEIFGIAGPNGSGKSTLFNVITGIPFGPWIARRVRFDGVEIQVLRADASPGSASPAPSSARPASMG